MTLLLRRSIFLLAALILAQPNLRPALADSHLTDRDEAYAYWHDTYADWDREDVEAAGYMVDTACVSAAAEGLPAELGAMGYHAVNVDYATSGELNVEEPHIILLDEHGDVVGVEYEYPEVTDPAPEIAGIPLEFTPPHPGVDHEHMSLHIYFVGDEDERFGTWNTALSCPAEDEMAAEHMDMADEDDDAHDAKVVSASQPEGMPVTGFAELPGGERGLLLLAAAALLGLALVGRGMSRRYE